MAETEGSIAKVAIVISNTVWKGEKFRLDLIHHWIGSYCYASATHLLHYVIWLWVFDAKAFWYLALPTRSRAAVGIRVGGGLFLKVLQQHNSHLKTGNNCQQADGGWDGGCRGSEGGRRPHPPRLLTVTQHEGGNPSLLHRPWYGVSPLLVWEQW